jgi:hypothetical protein
MLSLRATPNNNRNTATTQPLQLQHYLPIILKMTVPLKGPNYETGFYCFFCLKLIKFRSYDSPNPFHRHVCYTIISGQLLMACFPQEKHAVLT